MLHIYTTYLLHIYFIFVGQYQQSKFVAEMMYGNESSNWKHTNDAAAKAAKKTII